MIKKILLLSVLLGLSACSKNEVKSLNTLAPKSEMIIESSKIQTPDFITMSYNADECYDITPDFIADNSDFVIVKYETSTVSFVLYDGVAYSIGTCFGGYGITSMALADLNADGQYELYYTFSWGSGIHRSQIGCFDPVSKEVTISDDSFIASDMMLTVNDSGELCVNSAVLDTESFVDFTIKAQDLIGTVSFDEDEIRIDQQILEGHPSLVFRRKCRLTMFTPKQAKQR